MRYTVRYESHMAMAISYVVLSSIAFYGVLMNAPTKYGLNTVVSALVILSLTFLWHCFAQKSDIKYVLEHDITEVTVKKGHVWFNSEYKAKVLDTIKHDTDSPYINIFTGIVHMQTVKEETEDDKI